MKRQLTRIESELSTRGPSSWQPEALLAWYKAGHRDLPWRRSSDPYAIWVSEIMLQQTQVATVIPYFERWMERFPTVESLAQADDQEVLSMWQGLGYYRRGRMLLEGARWVVAYGMPRTAEGWLSVPGVGRYTAGAISSIAFGEPAPLVDGNVERVYARLIGSEATGPALNRETWAWAEVVLDRGDPSSWNQALMELGATVCRPKQPTCDSCPIRQGCVARASWRTDALPVRQKKRETVVQWHHIWVPVQDGQFGLRKIPTGQWWEGMWEFPRVVDAEDDEPEALREVVGSGWVQEVGHFGHVVTHHRIRASVSLVRADRRSEALTWYSANELRALPMPAPQRRALKLALSVL